MVGSQILGWHGSAGGGAEVGFATDAVAPPRHHGGAWQPAGAERGCLEFAARGLRAENGALSPPLVMLDVDSLPIEGEAACATGSRAPADGHQPKAGWNGQCRARIYRPLVISIAETSDMLDARRRPDDVGTMDGTRDVILEVVDRARAVLCKVAVLRLDLGFPPAPLLAGLQARRRLRSDRWRPSTTGPVCAPTPRSIGWLRPT